MMFRAHNEAINIAESRNFAPRTTGLLCKRVSLQKRPTVHPRARGSLNSNVCRLGGRVRMIIGEIIVIVAVSARIYVDFVARRVVGVVYDSCY